ncbi:hypothetical protein PGTUg99_033366 [Puccinia graminis f. sp. tritici]|uniref:CAP-Gly domain-containing protein n=1 Tax=Puccinia graminis f. sp. tritici TaxID=56615 RepID=A0A5B0RM49_PUCGR|nr:hypothetical protein PGTUg99_033366 [Puccinia graminis f. sp. tritici]
MTTTNHLISIWVSSPDSYSERRWSPHLTISELRAKLQPITGIPAGSQRLALSLIPGQSDSTRSILLDNDQLSLLDYGVQEGATIDVIDTDPHAASQAGQYNDVSQVEKFELPKEEYEKRSDSLLAFKMRNKLGRFNDPAKSTQEDPSESATLSQTELLERYPLGSRCQVSSLTNPSETTPSRGTIRFVGPVEFNHKHPYWIGIELDEPTGKNDGSVELHRYFTCPPKRGIFVQPDRILIGDFPPIDLFQDDDDDEI